MAIFGLIFRSQSMRKAFSLVELSIVLAIMGVVITSGLLVGTIIIESTALKDSQARIDEVDNSVRAFVQAQGYLPCPASLEIPLGDAGFGTEERSGTFCDNSVDGVYRSTANANANIIYTGTIPTRALGLPDKMMADAYGNRFLYTVTAELVDFDRFNALNDDLTPEHEGEIIILDRAGTAYPIGMAYAIISTGGDGRGGYRYKSGAENVTCNTRASAADFDNCNFDNSSNVSFTDTRFNDGERDATFFDDIIRYTPKYSLTEISNAEEQLCNVNNVGLMRFDVDAEFIQECNGDIWENLPGITVDNTDPANRGPPTGSDCGAHQLEMVRRSPSSPNTRYDFCGEVATMPGTLRWQPAP